MPSISREQLQELLDKEFLAQIELKKIQQAIQNLEKTYLQQKINMGNIAMGWNNVYSVPSKQKMYSHAKDRLFSQSSSTSIANAQLVSIQDANLAPFGQHRFKNLKSIRKATKKRLKSTRKVKKITKY